MLGDDAGKAFWADLRRLGPAIRRPHDHVWRLSVPPSRGAEVMAEIQGHIRADAWYDWGGGLIWCLLPALGGVCAEPIRAAAEAAGGHATLMRAPEDARLETPVFHPLSDAKAALVGRIKASFDPEWDVQSRPDVCGGLSRANEVQPRTAREVGHPGRRRNPAEMRPLRLLPRDLPDLCTLRATSSTARAAASTRSRICWNPAAPRPIRWRSISTAASPAFPA